MFSVRAFLILVLAVAPWPSAGASELPQINAAIRANDLPGLRRLVYSSGTANTCDGLKATPLHYAAIYGSVEALRYLLDNGADPNAANQSGATPLILAAWSFERTRLLVEHGANVNAISKRKMTPLLVAVTLPGNLATVRYLIEKGADVKALDGGGADAVSRAAATSDVETLRYLLAHGGHAKTVDEGGFTALINAANYPDSERIHLLLAAGADPNASVKDSGSVKNGPLALRQLSPLMLTAPYSDMASIKALLDAGARVNEKDIRGMTPLMLSLASDHVNPAVVRLLIASGADVQAKDNNGESVLDWAHKFQVPDVMTMLVAAGAKGSDPAASPIPAGEPALTPVVSVNRALALFSQSDFFRAGGGCAGCHHQPAYARAYAAAREANLKPNPALRQGILDAEVAVRPRLTGNLPYLNGPGGDFDSTNVMAMANVALDEPPSEFTDLLTHFLAMRQQPSGEWISGAIARPPIEESSISRTALGIEIMNRYALPARKAEFADRIAKAADWLRRAQPLTSYEFADRLVGLYVAGANANELKAEAAPLLHLQRADGGWAQTPFLHSDAYATGLVLDALFRSRVLEVSDPIYRSGVKFLLRTQFPDGSWYVRSRAPKFQPYFQSGFPYNHDQWISSIGSAYAVMALSHAAAATPAELALR